MLERDEKWAGGMHTPGESESRMLTNPLICADGGGAAAAAHVPGDRAHQLGAA